MLNLILLIGNAVCFFVAPSGSFAQGFVAAMALWCFSDLVNGKE